MWMIHPKFLCKKHLIGEHGEIHKFRPSFVKGHKIEGRRRQVKIDIQWVEKFIEYGSENPELVPMIASSLGKLKNFEIMLERFQGFVEREDLKWNL